MKRLFSSILFSAISFLSCDDRPILPAPPLTDSLFPRLVIHNLCDYDIWLQQENLPAPLASSIKILHGDYLPIFIPDQGLASTRFWPKAYCDAIGHNCLIGQSSPPCSPDGCAPPVDSKLEVTWGCTLKDKSLCGRTPQGDLMLDTWWNSSLVDGYTFPFSVEVSGGDNRAVCESADCSDLKLSDCPINEDLSDEDLNPQYSHENLSLTSLKGCFSPCTKLNYPAYGGLGLLDPESSVEQMYCCPTPPVSPEECQQGPVALSNYAETVHTDCVNSVYGYAYDDAIGLRNCSSDVVLEFYIGPNCP